MPTYQYRCRQCGEEFEKVQSFSDDSIPKCPGCGTRSKKNVAKIFGAVGISFKGSGFYKNDSSSKKSSSTSTGSSTSSDTAKSDSASSSSSSSSTSADSSSSTSTTKEKKSSASSSSD